MKVLFCGSRGINDRAVVAQAVAESGMAPTHIVSGGARVVDTLARLYAQSIRPSSINSTPSRRCRLESHSQNKIRSSDGCHKGRSCYNFHYSAFFDLSKIAENVCNLLKTLEPVKGLEPPT